MRIVPNVLIVTLHPNTYNLKPYYMISNTLYSIDRMHYVDRPLPRL